MNALTVLIRLLLPLVPILIYAPFTPHPLKTIALLEALLAFFVLLSWASNTIKLDGDVIQEVQFFTKSTSHHLRDIRRVVIATETGLFPSPRSVELQFTNGDAFTLPSLSRSDLQQILDVIRSAAPAALDPSLDRALARPTPPLRQQWRASLRSVDAFLLTSGALILLLLFAWWLLQHFGIV
jgi:hypothetical protein